ncbi:UDP-glucose--hexose-1-phosphate uridylyltransferase [Paenibacillus sp. HB172176]|uniref:UDP-glucose--hexose-1-phosphate uridylyltransferase n=1 Tax=Paenibacillus sp. HB172176 TaxID=2493690 RepID=UPI00143A3CD5|nr:UDP-glucose--hexose-1-phosphate uridylyltransferase [Paenibacillus sp. HB172176]
MNTKEQAAPTPEEALLLIERLLQFGLQRGLLRPLDLSYSRNALLDLFGFSEPSSLGAPEETLDSPGALLEPLLDYGGLIGLIPEQTTTYRDLLDAKIMGLLMPRPSQVCDQFERTAEAGGIAAATHEFYRMNIDSNYIRMDRIAKNQYWLHETTYGKLEITINLSKPEKDPREIAMLRSMPQAHYPKCLLCAENVGYAGRPDHPARQNLRVIPLRLREEDWFFQYSPYVYYNEHSIVFKGVHEAMAVTHESFARLLDFVEQMPHYFIGSNADLPIVGGSILSHDHFQAGRHVFPMETAPAERSYMDAKQPDVRFSIIKWPMTVIRLNSASKASLHKAACRLLDEWREYSDRSADVLAYSVQKDGDAIPHNTITPIARLKDNGEYEMDLVLRNNRTSDEHPFGIFHPHQELHHIKKENIGLIEVMGLAVLPGRLKQELEQIAAYLSGTNPESAVSLQRDEHPLHLHAEWVQSLIRQHGASNAHEKAQELVLAATGDKFLQVLLDAGVFKRTEQGLEAFERFLSSAGLARTE